MNSQKGFIQIPLLIAIIVGILVLGGGGYLGVTQYRSYQAEKVGQEKIKQEQFEAQQKTLEQAQEEIEKLKQENGASKEKQNQLENRINNENTLNISPEEIQSFLDAVLNVQCFLLNNIQRDNPDNPWSSGSGILWKWNNQPAILTNDHVMTPGHTSSCDALWRIENVTGEITGDSFQIDRSNDLDWNKETDVRVSLIKRDGVSAGGVQAADKNFGIYELRECPVEMALGAPVVVIGYPATTRLGNYMSRTITEGVVSAYDYSVRPPRGFLPRVNYFVSNKIDSGNSGGAAISKDNEGLCLLGLTTWLNIGNFETQGLIQNIHNVLFKQ